ncbi:MAG: TolC family protein [Spirochaetia bacterium]|jgi:outer membrane protein TolC
MPLKLRRGFVLLPLLCVALPALSQSTGLTLEDAYTLTRKASERVRVKELAVRKSRLALEEAGSRAWPHIDLQASASYLVNPPKGYTVAAGTLGTISPTIPAGVLGPAPIPLGSFGIPPQDFTVGAQLHNYFTASASLSQPIFTWGKIRNAIDLAALEVDAAGTELLAQQWDIDRDVHRAYFGALLARDSETVLRRIRDTAAEIAADRRKSFDQGTINKETVLEAQANLASLEAKLAEAGQSKATALESLGLLTGLEPKAEDLVTGFRAQLPPLDEQSLREKARAASTALAASRTRMSQARKKLALEEGGSLFRPDISLGLTLDLSGQEDLPFSTWNWNNTTWDWDLVVSIGMKMSVFDGSASLQRVRQAEKDLEMAGMGLSLDEKRVRLDVRRAVDAVVKADGDVKEKQARADYAEERLRNARASLENGMASRDDVHGTDILAGSAELDLLFARYTREEAIADIARITGERI